jgi:ATP-dependent helicase/nuclease subunit B
LTLRLLLGRAGSGKTYTCLREIREELARDPWGAPLLFLVPEQATFQMEYALVSAPGVAGSVRARVVSFRRLAREVLQRVRPAGRRPLDELGRQMLLRLVLRRHRHRLGLLADSARRPGFIAELSRAFREFRQYRMDPGAMRSGVDASAEPLLAAKLDDLRLLWEAYHAFLEQGYYDPDELLSLAARRLLEGRPFVGAALWVDGFAGFTPQEYHLLAALLAQAERATVALCLDPAEAAEPEPAAFYPVARTYLRLKDLAARMGLACREETVPPPGHDSTGGFPRFAANPALAHLEQEFTRASPRTYPEAPPGIAVFRAPDPWSEVEEAAAEIRRLVQGGYRCRDVAVMVRNLEQYRRIIEPVFRAHGIPYFLDYRRPASHHPLVRLLMAAVEVVTSGWASEPVFRALKTDLWPLGRREVDGLENYVLAYGIEGSTWTQAEPWDHHLGPDQDRRGFAWLLEEIDGLRRRLVDLFGPLGRRPPDHRQTGREWIAELWGLIDNLEVAKRLERWEEEAWQLGTPDLAEEHGRVWQQVVALFEELAEVLGEEVLDAAEFAEVLRAALEGLSLGLIPPGLDQVLVGSIERSRQPDLRAALVLGLNEGVFPARAVEEGLFDDRERELLARQGFELAPTRYQRLLAEDYLAYIAFTRPRETLWLSYCLADEEGRPLRPSPYLARLRDLFPALEEAHPAPVPAAPEESPASRESGRLPSRLVEARFPEPVVLSVSQLESFARCPFACFAGHFLDLRPRPRARMDKLRLGQWLHAALYEITLELSREGRDWSGLTAEDVTRCSRRAVRELMNGFGSGRSSGTGGPALWSGWLERLVGRAVEILVLHARAGGFRPVAVEVAFGPGSDLEPPAVELAGGRTVFLAGRIDRLEAARGSGGWYLRVIDFKSGQLLAARREVLAGLALALPLYLEAARLNAPRLLPEAGPARPAGMFYFPLGNPVTLSRGPLEPEEATTAGRRGFRLQGWFLAEEEVAGLMVRDAALRPHLLPGGGRARGEPRALSDGEMERLLAEARQKAAQVAAAILEGEISPRPARIRGQTDCPRCPYAAVCRRGVEA